MCEQCDFKGSGKKTFSEWCWSKSRKSRENENFMHSESQRRFNRLDRFLTIFDNFRPKTTPHSDCPSKNTAHWPKNDGIKFDKWNQIFFEIFACSWIEFHAKGHKILKFNIKIVTQIVAHLVAQEWLI